MSSNLLLTKIIAPARRKDALRRPRLLDFLHEYIGRKLILISAFAGYGKTSLLADFAQDTDLALCWYSLDSNDRDPQVFLEYLVAAIQRRFPHFGARITSLLRTADARHSPDAYVGALVTDIQEQIDEFFVLVLDDYQLVENSAPVNQLLDRLLYFLPENAHMILASRTVPAQLTLTRLTAQLQVTGLGTNDLRFTADEIRALVQQNYQMEITPTIAEELARQSEGWITGIVLTTPTMWRGLFRDWVKGHGPGSQMFDYLAVEVFQQQTPELQRFLLDTSILYEMDVALCNELFGNTNTHELLQLAEKRNLFVTRLGGEGYRYHHLFRDFLRQHLQQTQPNRYNDLLRRAAALFERRGKMDQAIEQWLAADAPREAARLIQIVLSDYYESGRWTTLRGWFDALPEEVMREQPEMLLSRGTLDAEIGALDRAQRSFDLAIQEFRAHGDMHNLARALIESARYEPNLATTTARCEEALALLPEHEYFLHATAYRVLGAKRVHERDNAGAIPLLERAVELYEITNDRYQKADAEMPLGAANLGVGEWDKAMAHFANARAYWQRSGNSAKLANTLNSIAVALYERGDLEPATDLLLQALEQAQDAGHLRIEAFIRASLGDIYRDQEKLVEALDAYNRAAANSEKIREDFMLIYARSAAGDIWRLAGDLDTAEHVLETALQAAFSHKSGYQVALAQVSLGALRLAQNQPDTAAKHLKHALPLLEQAQSPRDVGRVHFYLAQAALQQRGESEALVHLRAVAKIGRTLGETQFLVSQARHARRVLDYALHHRSGVSFFRELANRLDHLPNSDDLPIPELATGLPELELYTFGEARVVMDGKVISQSAWQTATTKELFFFFATNPKGWRKEQIFEELWMDATRSQANDLFHASMYRLRRALFPDCIVFRDGVYRLNHEAVRWLDVREFEQEYATVVELTEPGEQVDQLERVVALYRGDFLHEFYGDWCMARREELRLKYLDALTQLANAWFRFGNMRRAEEVFHKAIEEEPSREETYRALMALYAAMGDRVAVIQTYQRCVEALKTEVGVKPLPETDELFHQLVRKSDR